jgi:flavin reductase (DIM6/NTAB) family NADH-FMN oxidoreductase RutF
MTEEEALGVLHAMPYGLYIVGSREEDGVNGMMADWVMQVSFDPRLLAVALENDSHTLDNIRVRRYFTVNLLSQDGDSMELARRFAQPYDGGKVKGRGDPEAQRRHLKLEGLDYTLSERGCPVLDAAMAWLECEADAFLAIGDHTLVVGRVLDGRVERDAEALTSAFTGWTYGG